jgi:4-oxalocrotonate tautomerase
VTPCRTFRLLQGSGGPAEALAEAGDCETVARQIRRAEGRLAQALTDDVMKVLHYGDESVSVAFEEVDANDWDQKMYEPDIVRKADTLYKKPGYTM